VGDERTDRASERASDRRETMSRSASAATIASALGAFAVTGYACFYATNVANVFGGTKSEETGEMTRGKDDDDARARVDDDDGGRRTMTDDVVDWKWKRREIAIDDE